MTHIRLNIRQICEALSDDNRFYASRYYGQPGHELTTEQLCHYYVANTPIGMTVIGFDVAPPQAAEFCAQLELWDNNLREDTMSDPHKPKFVGNQSERL